MPKLRVLIVDDDQMVRAQLSALLEAANQLVYELPSAIGVTRAVVTHQIDVVVIDVSMPTLSGDKLAALLRKNTRFKELAVVLISGRPIAELEQIARDVAADAVVTKADAQTKLVSVIERAASLRGRKAGPPP